MGEHNDENYCQEFRDRFLKAISFAHQYFGENAFHNISPSNPDRAVPAFSATIFDSVLIAIDIAIKEGQASNNAEDIAERRKTLLLDRDFQRLISFETMRTETIRGRVWRMYQALFTEV